MKWRAQGSQPPGRVMIYSPDDTEARLSKKRSTEWQDYKVHLAETVDPHAPQLITDVATSAAPANDKEALPEIQARLARHEILPETQLVDAGYVTAG